MIEIGTVSKVYGGTVVVDGVSLTLPKGGVTAIIGPNGAGKSTLLSMIARLIAMDGGTVAVDGLDVATTPGDALARRLSILRQENGVAARLTMRELVAFGRYPHTKGRPTADDARRVEEALAYLGLETLGERFLDELSGGQRQRAFVAMALCQDADYMLFDEPLNNLDIRHAVSMMKLLKSAAADLGKTVVVVLHDINFASVYSDRIVAMRAGKVFVEGAPDAIMSAATLAALYETPFEIHEVAGRRIATFYG
jgi:iron complex transport system ATP-binding protein